MPKTGRIFLAASLCLANVVFACGPGGGTGRRPSPRRLTPLLRGQFVPSVSEGTIGASGPGEGHIRRASPKFSKLVSNYNPDVIFADQERDGSDRIMSKRCKDRVDTLAFMVANRWSGVRLRVTEAWDAETVHPEGSLHYEGRAVDITTSDRDQTKYGMLARMAVDAGFDWVFYGSKYYVHASVRADGSQAARYGGCFPGGSHVLSEDNRWLRMDDVAPGDRILAADRRSGQLVFSDVIMMMDRRADAVEKFVEITTMNRTITLTRNHMIFVVDGDHENRTIASKQASPSGWQDSAIPVFAGDVTVGQRIYIKSRDDIFEADEFASADFVTAVRNVVRRGVMAPLTSHGTLVVDGAVASCYSVFNSEPLAHASFLPVRTFNFLSISDDSAGMHWYTRLLDFFARLFLPSSMFRAF